MTNRFPAGSISAMQLRRALDGKAGVGVPYGDGEGPGQFEGPPKLGPPPALVHEPGGQLVLNFVHPAFGLVDREFRVRPNRSWFSSTINRDNTVIVQLGALQVPDGMILFLMDYRFFLFRQSGVDPFDFIEAEPGRFSGFMGFAIDIGGQDPGNLEYQLNPLTQQLQPVAFQPPIASISPSEIPTGRSAAQFDAARSNSFAGVSGVGSSLLPVQSQRQGPRDQPFMYVAGSGSNVNLKAVIFRRVTTPLVAIVGKVSGYLLHQNVAEAVLNRVRPQ